MNKDLTEDYLNMIVGPQMFTPKSLLVWDSFRLHISVKGRTNSRYLLEQTV